MAHIKTKAIRDGFTNRPIERYHNEIRENLKTKRGLGNNASAQEYAEMLCLYHNFIKPHMGLDGKTPAEVAGLDLGLGDDKLMDLIRQSSAIPASKCRPVVELLGDLIKHIDVINDPDSSKVVPKTMLRKAVWDQIDTVLNPLGFAWMEFGNDKCWFSNIYSHQ